MTRIRGAAMAAVICLAAATWARPVAAQGRLLTLDDLFDPAKRLDFGTQAAGPGGAGVAWIDETHYRVARELPGERGRFTHMRVDAASGAEESLFDPRTLQAALAALPGVTTDEAARLARQRTYTFNPASSAMVLTVGDDLYFWLLGSGRAVALSASPGTEQDPTFSPDGRQVAYTREGNLYVAPIDGGERALTTDGSAVTLNGRLDWVYQEEIYGRGSYRAFWWSPDSTRLAFLQLDDRPVPEYAVVDHVPETQTVDETRYPRPGEPNPAVHVGFVSTAGGSSVTLGKSRHIRRRGPARRRRLLDARLVTGGRPGAGPRADVARSRSRGSRDGRSRDVVPRDHARVGERQR